eukprot:TRINITY_DN44796_c0_g1_i1.p4 TRINITY_DN44796_c0_g1~~TRINITY_DN44796_c0_g1_i1.p4  ORF type:complete len:147 (-),score=16.50 TRINITY_DN44796_c0_g1_i1:65-505(-)
MQRDLPHARSRWMRPVWVRRRRRWRGAQVDQVEEKVLDGLGSRHLAAALAAAAARLATLLGTLRNHARVLRSGGLGALHSLLGLGPLTTLALQTQGGDEALDLGGLAVLDAVLARVLAADDELAHVVLLGQVEQLAQPRRPLGARF